MIKYRRWDRILAIILKKYIYELTLIIINNLGITDTKIKLIQIEE